MSSPVSVGIFDSGVGGLSILREVRRALPSLNVIYFADSRYAPYGDRTVEQISQRATSASDFLVQRGASALVVACNTATEVAVDTVRARHSIPVVGLEPAVKPAVAHSRTSVIGVLATSQTLASAKYSKLIATHASSARVLSQACPGLVECVEAGDLTSDATRARVAGYVKPLVDQGADTLVLGCTHYPFLLDAIVAAAGPGITILESAGAVARQLRQRLAAAGIAVPDSGEGSEEFWTTGDPHHVGEVMSQLLGRAVALRSVPDPWSSLTTTVSRDDSAR
ncbi:MAG: glutamate racemase [Acidobacteria bacterium]|nr:glutamate racemase [Acidobacteriota bacterium]